MGANKKKKVNKIRIQPCKICKKNHLPDIQIGNSVGDGGELAINISKNKGYGINVKKCKENHDLRLHVKKKNKKGKEYDDYHLQAHHLICSESMDDGEKGNNCWMSLCNNFGYDINCFENGVFLPSSLESACTNRVPLHLSNHDDTFGAGIGSNYVQSVIDLIEPIKANPNYCDKPENFKKELDKISKKIFGYVKSFQWTITADGRDYQGKIGCLNCDSFVSKRYKIYVERFNMTEQNINNLAEGDVLQFQTKVSSSAKTLGLFCNSADHKYLKYRLLIPYPLEIGN
jgi:hypothetical protein